MKTWSDPLFSFALGLLLCALLVAVISYGAAIPLPQIFPQSQYSFYIVTAISYLVSVSILTIIAMSAYGTMTVVFNQRPRLSLTVLLAPLLIYASWVALSMEVTVLLQQVILFAVVMVVLKKMQVTA